MQSRCRHHVEREHRRRTAVRAGCLVNGQTSDVSVSLTDSAATMGFAGIRAGEPMRIRNRQLLGAYIGLLGLSERQFARRAGLSHSTVNHLLSGRRSRCSRDTAAAIEATLRCPAGLIFETEISVRTIDKLG